MKYKTLSLFLFFLSLSCKSNFSPLQNEFCSEEDFYDGFIFSGESADTLDYIMQIDYEGFTIFSNKMIYSSSIYLDDILLNIRWDIFNDSASFCKINFEDIAELNITPNVPINLDLSLNDNYFTGQIALPNHPIITFFEHSDDGRYLLSWDLSGHADTQVIFVNLNEVDTVNMLNFDNWQYSGYRRCHVIPQEFLVENDHSEYEIEISVHVINYFVRKRFIALAMSWDHYSDTINMSDEAFLWTWHTQGY